MFTEEDCWLLFSINFSKKGSGLTEIIANGDRINHAIFTKNEIENGLNKLIYNGYIIKNDNRFFTTKKANWFFRKNKRIFESYISEWIRISKIFIKQPFEQPEMKSVFISELEYDNAINEYKC